jgi:mRNA-degrading endonuclease RelE of RelBE toxin-antitoxin system
MIIHFTSKFSKDLSKIDDIQIKQDINDLIVLLESANNLREIPNVKKLKGAVDAYRVKLDNYRICFYYNKGVVYLARALSRKDVYKYFP